MKDYDNALEYLYNIERRGIIFGLDNIRYILNIIGNPHSGLKTIHVGGTNGKGSVSTILSDILTYSGYRVGKYTSPHLVSFTERITINGHEISEHEVATLVHGIRERIEKVPEEHSFTFFDFTTALAFEYFKHQKVDVAIIEVGLGGRLDSTNVVEPIVTIITNVHFDHTDYLGNNLEEITQEKAGIIKQGVPVVTGADGSIARIIEQVAERSDSPVYRLGKDFFYTKIDEQRMAYRGLTRTFPSLYVKLKGDHQFVNVSIALCVVELLLSLGFSIDERKIFQALSEVILQGRLECVREKPLIVLDVAHNPHGIHALCQYVTTYHANKKIIAIFGVMKDKDYHRMLKEIIQCTHSIILTKPNIDRALSPDTMKHLVPNPILTYSVQDALKEAKKQARHGDMILITGSFYTIGEAKPLIHEIF